MGPILSGVVVCALVCRWVAEPLILGEVGKVGGGLTEVATVFLVVIETRDLWNYGENNTLLLFFRKLSERKTVLLLTVQLGKHIDSLYVHTKIHIITPFI